MHTASNWKLQYSRKKQIVKWYDGFCICYGALGRAFRFNFSCLGAKNANRTNLVAPERCSGVYRVTLTTNVGPMCSEIDRVCVCVIVTSSLLATTWASYSSAQMVTGLLLLFKADYKHSYTLPLTYPSGKSSFMVQQNKSKQSRAQQVLRYVTRSNYTENA